MNTVKLTCEKARDISIVSILENLGHFPKKTKEKEAWFLSPFRSETQASFKVNLQINRWFDHGIGQGGNVIDLVVQLKNISVTQTLEYLNSNLDSFSFHQQTDFSDQRSYKITKTKSLSNEALIDYLITRKINIKSAMKYCSEIYYSLNDRKYFAIAFQNISNGYEIRNKYFKGSLGKKDLTLIKNESDILKIFEGFIDFLSYLTLQKNPKKNEDFLILNSISFTQKAINYIENYNKVFTYLDNDRAGKEATELLKKGNENVFDQSKLFKGYKDYNEYLISTMSSVKN